MIPTDGIRRGFGPATHEPLSKDEEAALERLQLAIANVSSVKSAEEAPPRPENAEQLLRDFERIMKEGR